MYQTKNLGLNITEIEKDTLSAFNFDTDLGDNFKAIDEKTLSHRNITNCLLEVPQDIKLELVDGVLTLKEGSKGYLADGTEIITQTDLSTANSQNGQLLVFVDSNGRMGLAFNGGTITADPDITINNHIYFNSTSKKCLYVADGGFKEVALPLANITVSNGAITSIDQVFNGMGFIGSTVFALPGVKCLIPNGRNEDGSLNNIEYTTETVITHTSTSDYSNTNATLVLDSFGNAGVHNYYEGDTIPTAIGYAWVYHRPSNQTLQWDDATAKYVPRVTQFAKVAKVNVASGKINVLTVKQPFHAVDFNDYQTKITELETKIATLQAAVEALQGS